MEKLGKMDGSLPFGFEFFGHGSQKVMIFPGLGYLPPMVIREIANHAQTHTFAIANYTLPPNNYSSALQSVQHTVIGHSIGGRFALWWAIKHSQNVDRLLLAGPDFLSNPDWVALVGQQKWLINLILKFNSIFYKAYTILPNYGPLKQAKKIVTNKQVFTQAFKLYKQSATLQKQITTVKNINQAIVILSATDRFINYNRAVKKAESLFGQNLIIETKNTAHQHLIKKTFEKL